MPRSVKKGPFVDLHLAKKVQVASEKNDRRPNKESDKLIVRRRRTGKNKR